MASNRKTKTHPIKWQQAQSIVKCLLADQKHNTALLFASGFYFGLRISDILKLKWEHIKSNEFTITEQKTKKTRTIQVHTDFKKIMGKAIEQMEAAPVNENFVFVAQKGNTNKPISVIAANKRIKNAFINCGIATANPSSHTLRKTFGKRVYENNGRTESALILLSKVFNHRDISITREYIGITKEQIDNAYLSL